MAERWSGRSQAKAKGFSIFIWWIKHLPLIFSYILLSFVALYYLFFSKVANLALKDYFNKMQLSRPNAIFHRYKSFILFGQSIIDKLAIYAGAGKRLSFDFENETELRRLAATGKGALLLGAHVGNWEIAGQLLYRIDAPVYVVMRDNEEENIKKLLERHSAGKSFSIIPISEDATFVFKIKEALSLGGLVCMHADRYLEGMRTLEGIFLGHSALFPLGPFYLGSRLNVPVAFVYAMKEGRFHYRFSCSESYTDLDAPTLLNRYLQLLESKAKAYPHQWYNFYPFWQ
ncbi:MAG: hypothetical protein J5I59_07360 [Saprospiraceae bacterium]|nr:hypothetical protein [Saprospiraceae bacterium]